MTREEMISLLTEWEQYKKANWYHSDAIDVEKYLMEKFAEIKALPLPPAEGAEAIVKKYEDEYDFKFHWVQRDRVIRMMREFAAQQQPTAEGVEEILRKNCNTCYSRSTGEEEVWSSVSSVLIAMQDFASLHAQRIAEKMVSERLRGELIRYIKWYGGFNYEDMTDEMLVNEYLKSRDNHE